MTRTEAASGVRSLMPLYEHNYRLMVRLVPALRSIDRPVSLILHDHPISSISVTECTRYTCMLVVRHAFGPHDDYLLPDIRMQLRVYHDARLIEVLSYQNRGRLAPFYSYPNSEMFCPFEKRQVNLFLSEWLWWSLRKGRAYEYDPAGFHVSFC
jgi:uncharacterized protein YqiB (DUF1249 family)